MQARAGEHPRIASIASLEERILAALPPAMMRPVDLVAAGLQRLNHVDTLFGPIEIVGITELSPCWRPLLHAIGKRVPVRWTAGPRGIPAWLDGGAIVVARAEPHAPEIITVSASTAHHEAIEALRWARQLIASGTAAPAEIAIASVTPADYDDHFLALRADANLDLYFVHGVKITACREGQAAAALADIVVRGLSQTRMRRLASLLAAYPGPFKALPAGWTRVLPADAPVASPQVFATILATSERQVVLSRARRDSDGRLLGRSTLLPRADEIYLRRNRIPDHAFSETDRLTARPQEFRALPQAAAAATCCRN